LPCSVFGDHPFGDGLGPVMRAEVGGSLGIFVFVVPRDGARTSNLLEVVTRQVEIVVLGQDRLPLVRGRRSWTRSDQPTAKGRSPAYGVLFIAVTPPLERASPEARRFRHIARVPVKGRHASSRGAGCLECLPRRILEATSLSSAGAGLACQSPEREQGAVMAPRPHCG
jgi:hypothetical protein